MPLPFTYSVQINDPDGLVTAEHAALLSNLEAAIGAWARYVGGSGSIEVELLIDDQINSAYGRSETNTSIGQWSGKTLVRDSVPHELMTGIDLNGSTPDAVRSPCGRSWKRHPQRR